MPRGRRARDKVDATISQDGDDRQFGVSSYKDAISREERNRLIAERVAAGESVRSVAGTFDLSPSMVSIVARDAGIEPDRRALTAKAIEANRWLAVASRLGLLAKLFDRVDKLSDEVKSPRDVKDLALTAAILVDKIRLETGESTSRAETIDRTAGARQRLLERLQTYSARKGEDGVYVVETDSGATGS